MRMYICLVLDVNDRSSEIEPVLLQLPDASWEREYKLSFPALSSFEATVN